MFRTVTILMILACFLQCKTTTQPAALNFTKGDQEKRLNTAGINTFILVRHAEKQDGPNPSLTPEGQERALRLAQLLSQVSIDRIYSSDYKRTQETAQPLATLHNLPIKIYDPGQISVFAEELLQRDQGETIVVVGHSNTTPALANLLSQTSSYASFAESDYGNIIFVNKTSTGLNKIYLLRF